MRTWLLLMLFLVIAACAPMPAPESIVDSPQQVSPPSPPPKMVDIPAPEPIEVIEPLKIELIVAKRQAELLLDTTARCIATGGKEPLKYEWSLDKEMLDCKERCPIVVDEISNPTLTCMVSDTSGQSQTRQETLNVTKQLIEVTQIITLGDSLTYGHGLSDPTTQAWPALMSKRFPDAVLTNPAVSGSTSWNAADQALEIKDKATKGHALVFLWVGANDIPRMIPLDQYEKNLRFILDNLRGDATITMITIPDVSKLWIAEQIDAQVNQLLNQIGVQGELQIAEAGKETITKYNTVIKKVADEYNVEVVDMFEKMDVFDQSWILPDQVHPNAEGHRQIEKILLKHLEDAHPLSIYK